MWCVCMCVHVCGNACMCMYMVSACMNVCGICKCASMWYIHVYKCVECVCVCICVVDACVHVCSTYACVCMCVVYACGIQTRKLGVIFSHSPPCFLQLELEAHGFSKTGWQTPELFLLYLPSTGIAEVGGCT